MTRPKSAKGRGWKLPPDVTLDARKRRELLEALGPSDALAKDVIEAVEMELSVAVGWRASRASVAGRRRLLDQLISAAAAFERALLELDTTSWNELAGDVDREKAELPFSVQRHLAQLLDDAQPEKRAFLKKQLAAGGVRLPPSVPPAMAEIVRAARAQRARLDAVETRGTQREDARDNAIKRAAEVFHNSAVGARDYRGRLIDFVTASLKAAKLTVPESEEKVWQLIPTNLRSLRTGPTPTRSRHKSLSELVPVRGRNHAKRTPR